MITMPGLDDHHPGLGDHDDRIAQERALRAFLRSLFRHDWIVYAKRPFGGPAHVPSLRESSLTPIRHRANAGQRPSGTTTRNEVGRLNADGSLDTSFNPGANNTGLTVGTTVQTVHIAEVRGAVITIE